MFFEFSVFLILFSFMFGTLFVPILALGLRVKASQQAALNAIAAQLAKDGRTGCTAPQISNCLGATCSGTNCGNYFQFDTTSAGVVNSLFGTCEQWLLMKLLMI